RSIQHLARFPGQGVGRDRLLDEMSGALENPVVQDHIVRVPRHEEHADLRTEAPDALRQLPAVHPRYDDVGDQQIDSLAALLTEKDRLPRRGRRQHVESGVGEDPARDLSYFLLVLDEQDRLVAPRAQGWGRKRIDPLLAAGARKVEL